MPLVTAYAGTETSGINMPINVKNIDRIRRTLGFFNATGTQNEFVLDSRRALTVTTRMP